jgi:hypothetical protein
MKSKFGILIIACLLSVNINAQEIEDQGTDQNFTLSVDLVSNYVWRGLVFSDAPNVQPYLDFTTKNGIFTLGAFGSYSLSNYYSEVDLFASLNLGMFSFAIWDYFVMSDQPNNRFFDFKNESTGHALEGMVTFNGPESFPVMITAGMFFYGADKNPDGDNYYSSYIELAYPFKWKSNNLSVFAGITPKEGLYASEFAMHNIGITNEREIKINDKFSIPIKGSVIINPHLENIHFVLTITLAAND